MHPAASGSRSGAGRTGSSCQVLRGRRDRLRRQPRRLQAPARLVRLHYATAAVGSFVVAVTNNYTWNRLWTFRSNRGRGRRPGARFFVVSALALTANLVVLAAARRARRARRGACPGDRDRPRHPRELRRQQAVVVPAPAEAARSRRVRICAALVARGERRTAPVSDAAAPVDAPFDLLCRPRATASPGDAARAGGSEGRAPGSTAIRPTPTTAAEFDDEAGSGR